MAITTVDGVIGAAKQRVELYKTASRTTVAGGWFCNRDIAGNPGAAANLDFGNTANGVVPTDATSGFPLLNAFGGSARGYISRAAFMNSVVCIIRLFDCVFACGKYAFNANVNLASQPDYSGRVSYGGGSADYTGLELWAEQVDAATGNQTVNVTYRKWDDSGDSSTGAVGIGAAPTVGRCWQLPLAAGDRGVRYIKNVTGGTGSAGNFNVLVLRPLADIYIPVASQLVVQNWTDLGLPEVFDTSAIMALVMSPSGTALGTQAIGNLDVING